jgi:predicted amidophosphoribosyltransferase
MNKGKTGHICSRCRKSIAKEEICSGCKSDLLELYDHRISWRMALDIEREEREGENIFIEVQ